MERPDLFRAFHDVLRLPAGGGAEVVYALISRTAHVLPPGRARALRACHGLATLDQHAVRVAAELGAAPAAVRAELGELAQEGLLVRVTDLLRRVGEARADPPPPVASLGIPTARRPASLREALDSYVDDALRHGRALDYVVADGAADEAEAAPVRAVVAGIRARRGVPVAYAGRGEKLRFAGSLARRAGVDPALVAFALLGDEQLSSAVGGNRNALLLHGAGDLLLQVDDDTRCRIRPPPDPLPGITLSSIDDPSELWPLAPPGDPPDRPFAALHEELLGRAAGDCAAARPEGLDLGGATGMLFRRIEARGGRVLVTQCGSRGDAGTGSMVHLVTLEGRSRDRLLAAEGPYREAHRTRRLIRASPRPAVGDGAACMSMALGLDARAVLPPFPPSQRSSDAVFGAVLRRCHHDALSGFVPWAVEHVPPGSRETSPEAFRESLGVIGANDVLRLLVAAARVEPDRDDPGRSLRALGEVLVRWGSLPLADFEDLARVQVLRARSLDLLLLDDALRRHRRAPAFWARDAELVRDALRRVVERPGVAWPADLTAALGEEAGRARLQALVRRYGELLGAWPALWEAARALRAEGVRLAGAG